MKDKAKRSLLKTITWRLTGSGSTFLIAWLVTGNISISSTILGIHFLTNTALYFVHERVWNHIHWGKKQTSMNGVLIRESITNKFFFRVYNKDHNFIDYDILHHDLSITINEEDAQLYNTPKGNYIDYKK